MVSIIVLIIVYIIIAIWLRILHIKSHLRRPDGKVSKICILSNIVLLLFQLFIIIGFVIDNLGLNYICIEDVLPLFVFIFIYGFWDKLRWALNANAIISSMLIYELFIDHSVLSNNDFKIVLFYLIIFNIFAYWHWLLKRNKKLDNIIGTNSQKNTETQELENTGKSSNKIALSCFVSFVGILAAITQYQNLGALLSIVIFLMIIMPLFIMLDNVKGFLFKTIADILLSFFVSIIISFPFALLIASIDKRGGVAPIGTFCVAIIIISAIIMIGRVICMIINMIQKERQLKTLQNKIEN